MVLKISNKYFYTAEVIENNSKMNFEKLTDFDKKNYGKNKKL